MKSLHNIEPSAFTRGAYVGYAAGAVWTITRASGYWQAIPLQADSPPHVRTMRPCGSTLTHLSALLDKIA